MHRSSVLRAAVLAVVLGLHVPALAQEEDPKKEAAAWVQLAAPAVRRGDWEAARSQLGKAVKADPANADAALLLARVHERTGSLRKAIDLVSGLAPDVRVLTRKAELLLLAGDAEGSEAAARDALKIDENALAARRVLGASLEETGKREAATEQYVEVNKRWARQEGEDSDEDLLTVARARLGIFRCTDEYKADVNGVVSRFEAILKRKEPPEEALVEAGDLYLKAHSDIEAKKWFRKAAEMNSRSAAAIFGLARQLAFRYETIDAAREAEKALVENPELVDAHVFLAEMALGDGAYDKAADRIGRALAVNPAHAEARGLRAALHYLRGDTKAFEDEVKAVLARNRFESAPYRGLSRALEEQRRFAEALEFAERAAQVDPLDWDAYFAAGRNAMNVGDDAKAERFLRAAEKGDAFPNRYRRNFIVLFDAIAKYVVVKSPKFEIKLSPQIEKAYGPLVVRTHEESLAVLRKRWDFEAETPVYVSIFDRQDDFAARTIGLPGFPALGACFGRVVTLDSPRALPPGAFGWRATLHHELAHVITLQLSKGRVPRWLTEGLSVYEERKVSPVWNREMEQELVNAIASGEVLTLTDVNQAFRGPRVMYAYYQGGLMCEFVERDFGFPKLREMVRLYGEGLDTPDVVRRALGIEPAEFDRRFLDAAKAHVASLRLLPSPSADATTKLAVRLRKDTGDAAGWALLAAGRLARGDVASALQAVGKLTEADPGSGRAATLRALIAFRQQRPDAAREFAKEAIARGDDTFQLRMALAEDAQASKNFGDRKEHLRRAIELFPVMPGAKTHRTELAEMLLGEGEKGLGEAMKLLVEHAAVAEDDFAVRSRLAAWHREHARTDDELRMLGEIRDIVPLPNQAWSRETCVGLHERMAEIYSERKLWDEAAFAAGMAAEVASMELSPREAPPEDAGRRAALIAIHAEALRMLGRRDEARARAEEAIRIDAGCDRAIELLDNLKE